MPLFNHVREAAGPGWALVGDASEHRDPITGHGITDAFRDAELLAWHLGRAMRGETRTRVLRSYDIERFAGPSRFRPDGRACHVPAAARFIDLQRELGLLIELEAIWLASQPEFGARPDSWRRDRFMTPCDHNHNHDHRKEQPTMTMTNERRPQRRRHQHPLRHDRRGGNARSGQVPVPGDEPLDLGTHSRERSTATSAPARSANTSSRSLRAVDHPRVLCGTDQAPSPVEWVLHALAGCLTAGIANIAAARGVELTEVSSTVEGDIDLDGILGLNDQVRNGYQQVRSRSRSKGDAAAEKLRQSSSSPGPLRGVRRPHQRRARGIAFDAG